MMRSLVVPLFTVLLLSLTGAAMAQPRHIRIGIVTDGPTDREFLPVALIERQIPSVVENPEEISFPRDKRFPGDWSMAGSAAVLDRALADPGVDIVVSIGLLVSQQAAQRTSLSKPVIALVVLDPTMQRFPLVEGASGRRNFTYVADFHGLEESVRIFQRAVRFKHLAALIDQASWNALPELAVKVDRVAADLSVRVTVVQTAGDPAAALAAIPADADAIFVSGLMRLSGSNIGALARGLIERRLPSFSLMGRSEVESGLLMTTGGAQRDAERLARRVVLTIQRIAAGEDPATFDVAFPTEQRLLINMHTAREIGYSPRWEDLADAVQIDAAPEQYQTLTLLDALQAALSANPAFAATRERTGSSGDDVRIARSNLLPSLEASAARTQIDDDRAGAFTQAEKTTSATLDARQILYSESAWANYSISRSLLEASRQGERQAMLDTLTSAASAYLDVLRAKSIETVRRSNVENTRKNLEIARVRETVGLGGRSDRLRWVSQLARDKQDLLSAESTRRQAETELARIIHRPGSRPFDTVETDLEGPLALVSSPRMRTFLDTPASWAIFTEYAVQTALDHAPELAQADAIVQSRHRALTAAKRSFFVPDVAVVSTGSRWVQRSGVGSTPIPGAPDRDAWSVSLQVSLPIFTGGLRRAQLSQAHHELRASEADSSSAADAIEARTRAALHRTSSSYPSIALSAEAGAAANDNLAMVTDAYARGAVSITDLIDAQNTALSAGLASADAKYGFLIDFVNVLRATSDFAILLDPSAREAWLRRVEDWFITHQPGPRPAPRP